MTASAKTNYSVAEYFARDALAAEKLEYFAGVIVAQAGASARHNLIVANLIGNLYTHVRQRGCHLFPSDMRVQAIDQSIYTYPDISVVCGTAQYLEPAELTLLNPTLIIEILSASTEGRDRKEKLEYYRSIPSLQEYILIGQTQVYAQRYVRQTPHFWYVHLVDSLNASLKIESLGCEVAMALVYDGIETNSVP
jgi:Uma2 family endonuclease